MKKENLPDEDKQKPIKLGSRVMVIDGSYMIRADEVGLDRVIHYDHNRNPIGLSGDIFKVIAVNTPLPTDHSGLSGLLCPQNNCVIKNEISGNVWYCSSINIRNIESMF